METIKRKEIADFVDYVETEANKMGYKREDNVTFRNATGVGEDVFDKEAFFGFIRQEEATGGPYSDLSLVFLPQRDAKYCIISLAVGSLGFRNDLDLALLPWPRRLFNQLRFKGTDLFFFKNDFANIENATGLYERMKKDERFAHLKKVVETYKRLLQACQIVELDEQGEYKIYVAAWLAQYATLRALPSNKSQRQAVQEAIKRLNLLKTKKGIHTDEDKDDATRVREALQTDRFVMLQGAPGTGKTYTALRIAQEDFENGNVFFEQFHAETTFSDFVYGITPSLKSDKASENSDKPSAESDAASENSSALTYELKKGVLFRAIERAFAVSQPVLLIIDEINRANLSNVLGPVFYLFEKHSGDRHTPIHLGPMAIEKIPDNLYMLATMNTADRSLAVVDFALRRRFTWLTLRPRELGPNELPADMAFHKDDFCKFAKLFERYATDEELNLQPGQSYFITDKDDSFDRRLRYELMPLMKEYFNEGFLSRAKDEFSNYFYDRIGAFIYE